MLKSIVDYFSILLSKKHEKKLINKLNLLNINPKIIFDVGSHLGEMTDLFLSSFANINKIYCFEPQKKIFGIFKNGFGNNSKVVAINKACSDKNSFSNFNISLHKRSSTLEKTNTDSFYYKIKSFIVAGKINTDFRDKVSGGGLLDRQTRIKTVTLDKYIPKSVDLLKIDVEGSELKVLCGCKKKIKNVKVIIIEIMNHNLIKGYSKNRIFSFLKKNNFKLHAVCKFPFYKFEDRIYINRNFFT